MLSLLGIGDWGLGIGDWGLGPIPNPQSPFLRYLNINKIDNIFFNIYLKNFILIFKNLNYIILYYIIFI